MVSGRLKASVIGIVDQQRGWTGIQIFLNATRTAARFAARRKELTLLCGIVFFTQEVDRYPRINHLPG